MPLQERLHANEAAARADVKASAQQIARLEAAAAASQAALQAARRQITAASAACERAAAGDESAGHQQAAAAAQLQERCAVLKVGMSLALRCQNACRLPQQVVHLVCMSCYERLGMLAVPVT